MILDGKQIAASVYADLTKKISILERKPKLVAILVGENPASLAYIRQKKKFALSIGMEFELRQFDISINEAELLGEIHILNEDSDVSGFIVQLPLPAHIDAHLINQAIDPNKDVDGFTPGNIWQLFLESADTLQACTPKGIMRIFEYYHIDLASKDVVIIGRSNIVGKPMALMCINAGATVTVCNHLSKDVASKTRTADIIICAVGKAGFLTKDMIQPGSIIIDVGINHKDGTIVGDADFAALEAENYITPVPGGVGPMTVAMLLENTYVAHIKNH